VIQKDAPISKGAPSTGEAIAAPEIVKEQNAEAVFLPGGMLKASPLARKMALEKSLDLSQVMGSGPGGRIVRSDVEKALSAPKQAVQKPKSSEPLLSTEPSTQPSYVEMAEVPSDQRSPMGRLRTAIGRRMVEAKQQLPHFYVTHAYDMEAVMRLRKELNSLLPDDEKLSVNDFIVKATAMALRRFPNLNASIDGDQIIRHGHINVGVAVSLEGGLLTVVCRDADTHPIRLISREVKEMAGRVRQGKVKAEDIEGSTFSVSNLGMFDVEEFVAIINPPEAAILAIGSVKEVPVAVNGEIKAGIRMKATLSADHRISDGAEAAQFLQVLAEYLENPLKLLL
jgi:pyruvate dehydrogenase E2 component (dihydrolipoamide acetyltransferase)